MGAFKGKYSSVESAACLDINKLVQVIKDNIKKKHPGLTLDESRELIHKNLNAFKSDDQIFEFTSVPNKLGGVRWLVICPKCKKRSLKLFKPVNEPLKEQKFFCSKCHSLRPPSALYGPTRRYKETVKPVRRMDRIKEILKNKNISEAKTRKLLDEYDSLDEQLRSSTFFRKKQLLSAKKGSGDA